MAARSSLPVVVKVAAALQCSQVPQQYPKSSRLLKRREFVALTHKGKTFTGQYLIIQWRKTAIAHPRLGITISKKFGKAHHRNRFKRLVRESFRLYSSKPAIGLDLNVRPRKNFEYLTLSAILADLSAFFDLFK